MDLTTTAPTIDITGITAPAYADVLNYLTQQYQAIFGNDVYLGTDSQDGQLLAIFAKSITDANAVAVAIYNAFSPATAQGENLSSVVKINGLLRNIASFSQVDLQLIGVAGTTILNGVVRDAAGYSWDLPSSVDIPPAGIITVTATCETIGAISALPNTVNQIATPTRGWQSATNASAAALGASVEMDPALRIRQARSTAIPSQSLLVGILGAVSTITGVTRLACYENDTGTTDTNGIPAHMISLVVEGGDATEIANTIAVKKTPGAGTYGTTTVMITDVYGITHPINFFRPTDVSITVAISLNALAGYNTNIGTAIQNAVAAYLNSLPIGQKVMLSRVYLPANLNGSADSVTYEITGITLNGSAADVAIAFNQVAVCAPTSVTLSVS